MTGSLLALLLAAWPFSGDLPDEQVVARAQGAAGPITITAGRLRRYAAAHPERSPRELAGELVEFELLAAEAARRGFAADEQVREEARPALVRRYLAADFERQWSPENLPVELVRESYERNKLFFVRPAIADADHVVLTAGGKRPEDPALVAPAQALMERFRADVLANPPADATAFLERADAYKADATALGLELRAERLGRFPLEGRYDPDFTRGVFALDAPGDITPVLTSGFGWHVARLQSKDPALNRSFEEVEAELRARIAPEVRTLKLRELGATLARQSGSELFPEILDEAEAQRAGP
ncbi:MAG: peptidyl-prolyl cis-trans isomerase [Myxococcales bacterium]|nr:peptidyl-prolyl cis-trans isomerase [Myxococcales bacterium]